MHLLALVALQSTLASEATPWHTGTNTYHSHVVESNSRSKHTSPEHKLENTHIETRAWHALVYRTRISLQQTLALEKIVAGTR